MGAICELRGIVLCNDDGASASVAVATASSMLVSVSSTSSSSKNDDSEIGSTPRSNATSARASSPSSVLVSVNGVTSEEPTPPNWAASACLRRLEPALAPAVAAEQAGEPLEDGAIHQDCAQAVRTADIGVVEGIGGLRVPLADGHEVVDLVVDLDLPAVVVARAGLGTLNHSALTVEALRGRGVEVTGVVLNGHARETLAERTNPDVLAEMTGCRVETLPSLDLDSPADAVEGVREHLSTGILPTREPRKSPLEETP